MPNGTCHGCALQLQDFISEEGKTRMEARVKNMAPWPIGKGEMGAIRHQQIEPQARCNGVIWFYSEDATPPGGDTYMKWFSNRKVAKAIRKFGGDPPTKPRSIERAEYTTLDGSGGTVETWEVTEAVRQLVRTNGCTNLTFGATLRDALLGVLGKDGVAHATPICAPGTTAEVEATEADTLGLRPTDDAVLIQGGVPPNHSAAERSTVEPEPEPKPKAAAGAAAAPVSRAPPSQPVQEKASLGVPLRLFWHDGRHDHMCCAHQTSVATAVAAGYHELSTEGYVLEEPMPGTVPLKLFWHDGRQDNTLVATDAGIAAVLGAGYAEVRTEGHVFPETAEGLVPLKLCWHAGRNDNAPMVLPHSHASAIAAAYEDVRVECWVLSSPLLHAAGPASPRPLGGGAAGHYGGSGGDRGGYAGAAPN